MNKEAYIELTENQNTHWWFCGKRALVDYFFSKYSKLSSPKVLDLGCGTGALLGMLKDKGQVLGVEYEKEAVQYCNEHFGNIVKQGCLPAHIPFSNSSFDVIISCDVLEHIDDDQASITRIHDLLKENGIFIITVPALQTLWSYNDEFVQHKRRYDKSELLSKLSNNGFQVKYCTFYNSLLFLPIFVFRKIKNLLNIKKPDLSETSSNGIVNFMLKKIFLFEIFLLRYFHMPLGVSLVAVAAKKEK